MGERIKVRVGEGGENFIFRETDAYLNTEVLGLTQIGQKGFRKKTARGVIQKPGDEIPAGRGSGNPQPVSVCEKQRTRRPPRLSLTRGQNYGRQYV